MLKQKLSNKRIEKGISQEKMADLLGLNTSNYNRRESGKTQIKIKEWEKIAEILEVAISEIFESEEANIYLNAKNYSNGQVVGHNNTLIGIDETTLKNLNHFINSLKETITQRDHTIISLNHKISELEKKGTNDAIKT
jgi:DNA-binding XRE family transcriptional regulator